MHDALLSGFVCCEICAAVGCECKSFQAQQPQGLHADGNYIPPGHVLVCRNAKFGSVSPAGKGKHFKGLLRASALSLPTMLLRC